MDYAEVFEITNGIWTVLVIFLIGLFSSYLVSRVRETPRWWTVPEIIAAASLLPWFVGSDLRAALTWVSFILINRGWHPTPWTEFMAGYLFAVVLGVLGTGMCLWVFSVYFTRRWRWFITAGGLVTGIALPVAVFVFVR